MNNKKIIAIVIITIVAVGAGGFFGGMKYGASKKKSDQVSSKGNFIGGSNSGQRSGGQGGQNGQKMGGGVNGMGGFFNGDIISKDDKSITVKTKDGNSKIIFFSDSTTVGKAVEGVISDLNMGQQVMINGKANSDGSLTAQNIQIQPLRQE